MLRSYFLSSFDEFRSAVSEEKSKMSQPIRSQGGHLVFPIGPKNTNLVEDVAILLPVKFHWIPFSGSRGEVENVSANQRPGRPSYFSDRHEKHKLGRRHWDLASCQVSLNSVKWFLRRSRKMWKVNDGRTDDGRTTDGRTDDGQRVITIVHLSLRLRCTKNVGRARSWPLWAGDLYTEVTVKRKYALPITFFSSHTDSWRFSEWDGIRLNALLSTIQDSQQSQKVCASWNFDIKWHILTK